MLNAKRNSTMEYVIWGVPKDQTDETLLLDTVEGKKIETLDFAQWLVKKLETDYSCTKCRIQKIDMRVNDIQNLFKQTVK